jgi:hypothetical protein
MLLMRRSIAPVVQILIVARAVTTVEMMLGPEAVKMLWAKHSAVSGPPKLTEKWVGCSLTARNPESQC